jgi:Ca2+-binding RTX toxin-like protein
MAHTSNVRFHTVIEALESRRLLAGVSIVDRVLTVSGSDAGDFIDLSNSEPGEVLVHLNGGQRSFRVSDFDSIRINGNAGNDHVVNTISNNTKPVRYFGGEGHDRIENNSANPLHFVGGNGNDNYSSTRYLPASFDGGSGVELILILGPADIDLNRYPTVEHAGSERGTLIGNALGNNLELYNGGGTIFGRGGNDTMFVSGTLTSRLDGGDGNDRLSAQTNASIAGPTVMLGGNGNDSLTGGARNDTLDGGLGADVIKGGGGVDELTYASRTTNLSITLGTTANDGAAGEGDNAWYDIERVRGGNANDYISATAANNVLYGNGGNDVLVGFGGNDALFGGFGNDRIYAGSGNDYAEGNAGNDTMYGEAGLDRLLGHDGDDTFYARDGERDTLDGGTGYDRAQRDSIDSVIGINAFIA